MKLLYITNGISASGGLERVLSIKATFLSEKYNYDVYIMGLNEGNSSPFYEFSSKIQFLSIEVKGNPISYIYNYIKGIQKVVDEINPDLISVCDDGLKAFFLPKIIGKKIPIIYERHVSKLIEMREDYSFVKKSFIRLKWMMMDQLANDFNQFIVLTEGNKKEWTTVKRLVVIPNPMSFNPEDVSSLEKKKILVVGRQAYQKGYDLLLYTWKELEANNPDWEIIVYGKFNPVLGLDVLKSQLNLKNIHFREPIKVIEKEYLDSSIYVMSSRFEGFGMVLIEAMACGVPCVSFNCDYGPSDIINDGRDGFIVEKGDIKSLASKIEVLMTSQQLRKEMGKKAKTSVQRFEVNQIVKQWDDLFKKVTK